MIQIDDLCTLFLTKSPRSHHHSFKTLEASLKIDQKKKSNSTSSSSSSSSSSTAKSKKKATTTTMTRLSAEYPRVTFITGAGISTSTGIADYRSSMNSIVGPGIWTIKAEKEKNNHNNKQNNSNIINLVDDDEDDDMLISPSPPTIPTSRYNFRSPSTASTASSPSPQPMSDTDIDESSSSSSSSSSPSPSSESMNSLEDENFKIQMLSKVPSRTHQAIVEVQRLTKTKT